MLSTTNGQDQTGKAYARLCPVQTSLLCKRGPSAAHKLTLPATLAIPAVDEAIAGIVLAARAVAGALVGGGGGIGHQLWGGCTAPGDCVPHARIACSNGTRVGGRGASSHAWAATFVQRRTKGHAPGAHVWACVLPMAAQVR